MMKLHSESQESVTVGDNLKVTAKLTVERDKHNHFIAICESVGIRNFEQDVTSV